MAIKEGELSRRWKLVEVLLAFIFLSILNSANSDTVYTSPSFSAAAKDAVDPQSPSENLSASSNSRSLPESPSDMGSIIPGIYKEYLPQPIFYESVVPAVYQYQTPMWNKTEVTFNNWYQCVTETVPYRYSCPVTFHMNRAIVNLHVDFEGLHPITDIHTRNLQHSMRDYYERLTSHSDFCDKIQRHFAGVWTESSELERYLTALQGCSRGSELHPYFDRSLGDYNYSIRQLFTKMENNFYNTFYKNILGSGGKNSTMDLVASALLSNTRTSLQGAILGQYYAEKNRWVHANQDCRQGVIPTSLVTPEKFNESLSAILKMSVFHHESDLSIPAGQMSKYYTLPLADCTHTADSFVVRVLIPILKKFRGQVFQLVHVHTIPFQYRDHICRVKLPPSFSSSSSENPESKEGGNLMGEQDSSMYLYNEWSHRAYPTKCKPNQLCKISQYMMDVRRSDPCVSSLISGNDTGIRTYCDFECLPKDDYVLPSVVRVSSNKFVITPGSTLSFQIVCGKLTQTEKLFFVKPDQIGAILVKMPCHCRLIIPHFNVFFSGQACHETVIASEHHDHDRIVLEEEENVEQGEVSITPIIPFMFGKVKGTADHPQEKGENSVNHMQGEESQAYYYDSLADGQLLNLTEMIDTERIENYIRSSEARREKANKKFKGMDFYAEKLQSGEGWDEHEGGGGGVGGFFFTIFIFSVMIILGLQIYIIVMFQRQQRITYSKDDRILYRVEPDAESLG